MINYGKIYGKKIAEKMRDLQDAFRANLNLENSMYYREMEEHNREEYAAENLSRDTDFIENYLLREVEELAIAILEADVQGMYYAGFVPVAKSYEDYREKERKQTDEYYKDLNREIAAEVNKTPAEKCNERIQQLFGDFENWGKPITQI